MCALSHVDRPNTTTPGLPMKIIKVLIVDEYLAVRQALAARLRAFPHIEVVATAGDFEQGLKSACTMQPDVILLELKGSGSLELNPVAEMNKALAGHPAGIIVLTSYADVDERKAALDAGARRYLLKHIDSARLLAEIEAVAGEVTDHVS